MIRLINQGVCEMKYRKVFSMPTQWKITGRSSTITNAFINSIIPVVHPTDEQIKRALETLGMDELSYRCAYCGSDATEWDHLRPLVRDKKPTGYISEIHNLVPSCGKCNQSKGNKDWRIWMRSTTARLSPTVRGVPDIEERIRRLEEYEKWGAKHTCMDFESVVGKDMWAEHQNNLRQVQELLQTSQQLAAKINSVVAKAYRSQALGGVAT